MSEIPGLWPQCTKCQFDNDISIFLTCEYNSVQAGFPPELHEMHHIPKPEGGMPSEHDTGLLEVVAEVSMDAGIMLQFVCLNELKGKKKPKKKSRQVQLFMPLLLECLFTSDYKCSAIYS